MVRGEVGATRRWFGGDPYLDSAHVAVSLTRAIGRRAQARLSGSVAVIDHKVNDLQDGRGYSATEAEFRITSWLAILGSISTIGRESLVIEARKDY